LFADPPAHVAIGDAAACGEVAPVALRHVRGRLVVAAGGLAGDAEGAQGGLGLRQQDLVHSSSSFGRITFSARRATRKRTGVSVSSSPSAKTWRFGTVAIEISVPSSQSTSGARSVRPKRRKGSSAAMPKSERGTAA